MGKILIPVPGLNEPVRIEELPGNTSEALAEWARCALQTDPDAIAMTVDGRAFEDWAPHKTLPQISCPTLLLQGNPELDSMLSDDDVKLALRLLPNRIRVGRLGEVVDCARLHGGDGRGDVAIARQHDDPGVRTTGA